MLSPAQGEERENLLRDLLGYLGERCIVHSSFHCDFGFNIHIGNDFVGNYHLTILDEVAIAIGHHVFIGPIVRFVQ